MQLADRLRGLEELEPCSATAIQVNASTRSIRIMRGFLLAKEAELARRSTELHSTGDGHTADKVLQNGSKVSQREAERTTKRAAALGRSDAMSKELADGRITAEHADIWHFFGTPEQMGRKSGILDEWCAKIGRDPSEIERSTGVDYDKIEGDPLQMADQYYELGFTQFTFGLNGPDYDMSPVKAWLAWRDGKNA